MFKNILIILLLTITVFSIFKYGASLKEKYDLMLALDRIKEQAFSLEKEKQNLLERLEKEKEMQNAFAQENSGLKENIAAARNRLMKLFREASEAQEAVEELNLRFSLLKAQNLVLIERDNKLKLKVSQVSQENEFLKARLGSVKELKKAIRELKIRNARQHKETAKKPQEPARIIEGNRGYLIKNGSVTYPAKVKIEVIPASPADETAGGPASSTLETAQPAGEPFPLK